ncbi:MAG: hypothetical protein Q9163_000572 [Psora crenata]
MEPNTITSPTQGKDPLTQTAELSHPEYLLWAHRLQIELSKVQSLISTNKTATDTRLNVLAGQMKVLAMKSENQHHDITALKHRIEDLELEAKARGRLFNAKMLEHFRARIDAQEVEARRLTTNQEREIRTLADIFITWRNEWRAEGSVLKGEIARLTTESGRVAVVLGSPAGSAATTMDDTDPSPQVPHTPSDSSRARAAGQMLPPPRQPSPSRTLVGQGTSNIVEYLRYGTNTIPESVRLHESDMVKAFVNGLSDKSQSSMLWERLDIAGWTWVNVEDLVGKMISDGKRVLRRFDGKLDAATSVTARGV